VIADGHEVVKQDAVLVSGVRQGVEKDLDDDAVGTQSKLAAKAPPLLHDGLVAADSSGAAHVMEVGRRRGSLHGIRSAA
jgi:hypothetical protein